MKEYKFNVEKVTQDLITWIKEWFDGNESKCITGNGKGCNAVIGISGGKDSTVVAALCVKALGKDRVIGVMMPNGIQKDISDSINVCKFLDINNYTINIEPSINEIYKFMDYENIEISDQTRTNLPARIRMSTLYAVAQSVNGRVSNNCNASENAMGYSTLFGDAAGSFSPLGKLTTVEIVQIGDFLGLPYNLVHKTPIDGLKTNSDGTYITDEQSMGITYDELHSYIRGDKILDKHTFEFITNNATRNKFKLDIIRIPEFEPDMKDLYVD